MTPTEALARIAALCDEHGTPRPGGCQVVDEVRAVLAAVNPETGDDRMADRAVWYQKGWEAALRERPVAIDRDALRHELAVMFITERHDTFDDGVAADRIVALVRPVAGVTLTPAEAELAATALRLYDVRDATVNALAARLEAAQ